MEYTAYTRFDHPRIPIEPSLRDRLPEGYRSLTIVVPRNLTPSMKDAQRVHNAEILQPLAPPKSQLEQVSTLVLGHAKILTDARDSILSCFKDPSRTTALKGCVKALGLGLSAIVALTAKAIAFFTAFMIGACIAATLICSIVGALIFLACVKNPVETIVQLGTKAGTELSWPFAKLASVINGACTGKDSSRAHSLFELQEQNKVAAQVGAWIGTFTGGIVGAVIKLGAIAEKTH